MWEEAQLNPEKRKHTGGIFDIVIITRAGVTYVIYKPDNGEDQPPLTFIPGHIKEK